MRWIRRRVAPEPEPQTFVKRIEVFNGEAFVGYGQIWDDGWTELSLIGMGPTIRADSFSQAMNQARNVYPNLDWDWVGVHA